MLFCERGSLLALNWLRTANQVVEQAGVADEDDLRTSAACWWSVPITFSGGMERIQPCDSGA
jgi:hypothetical protein